MEESIRDVVTEVPETTDATGATETSVAEETKKPEPDDAKPETLPSGTDDVVDETPKQTSGLA